MEAIFNENSDNDPVTSNNPRLTEMLKREVPTAKEIGYKGPGHFIQEEVGPEYAQLIIDFINGNPQPFYKRQSSIIKL